MDVKIGDITIPNKYGPKVSPSGGSVLHLTVSILGDQEILHTLHKLEKEKFYEFESSYINCIIEIENIKITKEEKGDQFINRFFFTMKIK